ncbi:MAG: hypothetical protein QM296_05745 [Bacillota bacterium]|nr:hypothetical protein [Bacillota bacterium]
MDRNRGLCPETGAGAKKLARGGQKMRWCPETGAGTKKLSRGGLKMRWCPETGAGAKKLSRGGQKMRWCPETGAGTKKLSRGGQKMRWCPGIRAGAEKLDHRLCSNRRCCTAAFFFIRYCKAAANESIGNSRAGDNCCAALNWEQKNDYAWLKTAFVPVDWRQEAHVPHVRRFGTRCFGIGALAAG